MQSCTQAIEKMRQKCVRGGIINSTQQDIDFRVTCFGLFLAQLRIIILFEILKKVKYVFSLGK